MIVTSCTPRVGCGQRLLARCGGEIRGGLRGSRVRKGRFGQRGPSQNYTDVFFFSRVSFSFRELFQKYPASHDSGLSDFTRSYRLKVLPSRLLMCCGRCPGSVTLERRRFDPGQETKKRSRLEMIRAVRGTIRED